MPTVYCGLCKRPEVTPETPPFERIGPGVCRRHANPQSAEYRDECQVVANQLSERAERIARENGAVLRRSGACAPGDDAEPAEPELVNHPAHYNQSPSGVECIDVVEHMTFNAGTAVKHLWRCGLKGDALVDLRKAKWYVEREIARLEKRGK